MLVLGDLVPLGASTFNFTAQKILQMPGSFTWLLEHPGNGLRKGVALLF